MIKKLLERKLRVWRFGVPVWKLGLAVLLVAAAAGQTVGPMLDGSFSGSAGLVVAQSVVLGESPDNDTTVTKGTSAGNDAIVTDNDEGTAFTAAFELHVGDTVELNLEVCNQSDAHANAILELDVPRGIDVEVDDGGSDLDEAQLTRNSWLLTVESEPDDDDSATLDIAISAKDDIKEGFYTITGRIVQVAN